MHPLYYVLFIFVVGQNFSPGKFCISYVLERLKIVSKAIRITFGSAFLRLVIGPKIPCQFLTQSEVKPKPVLTLA